jgi:hypothetical protein
VLAPFFSGYLQRHAIGAPWVRALLVGAFVATVVFALWLVLKVVKPLRDFDTALARRPLLVIITISVCAATASFLADLI